MGAHVETFGGAQRTVGGQFSIGGARAPPKRYKVTYAPAVNAVPALFATVRARPGPFIATVQCHDS